MGNNAAYIEWISPNGNVWVYCAVTGDWACKPIGWSVTCIEWGYWRLRSHAVPEYTYNCERPRYASAFEAMAAAEAGVEDHGDDS